MKCIKARFIWETESIYRYFSFPDTTENSDVERILRDLALDKDSNSTAKIEFDIVKLVDVPACEPIIFKPTSWDYIHIN